MEVRPLPRFAREGAHRLKCHCGAGATHLRVTRDAKLPVCSDHRIPNTKENA
jgi:hypothetical protein